MNSKSRIVAVSLTLAGLALLAWAGFGPAATAFGQNAQAPAPAATPAPVPAAAPGPAQAPAEAAAAEGDTSAKVIVPADTKIPLQLKNALNSRTAYVGQAVYCETIYPVTVGNRIVIPVGTYVKGAVTQVLRPGRIKGKAQLGLRFDTLTLPDGATHRLRATLSSYAGNGKEGFQPEEGKIQGESSKGQDVGTVASTAGEGAIIGAIAGRGVKGAGIGGAAGGLGGLIWVLATRGKEISIPERTTLELQLSAPLVFDPGEVPAPQNSPRGPALPRREPGPTA